MSARRDRGRPVSAARIVGACRRSKIHRATISETKEGETVVDILPTALMAIFAAGRATRPGG